MVDNDVCDFGALKTGALGVTPAFGTMLAESASMCLHANKHESPVPFLIEGVSSMTITLTWDPITPQHLGTYADMQETAEFGAYGVGIVFASHLVGVSRVERSVKGTGVDYWLGSGDGLLFQKAARLEASGILAGNDSRINTRVKQKLAQTNASDSTALPAYVAVVEFGTPIAHFVKKGTV